ncbi:MAG: hypothetical protein J6Q82_03625 [Clostridia bacterium]|nr:hypothetical protein [Clostridia bacterium]
MRAFTQKMISFLLLIVMLMSLGAPLLIVNASTDHESHLDPEKAFPMMRENSINYTCRYDEQNDKILISGTVNHDVMIEHREFFLDVYSIAPDQTVEAVVYSEDAHPKASMEIAIKFDFSLSALTMTERFSRYAIVLRAASGEKILGAEPQYIHVESTYEYDSADDTPYKGISSELTSIAGSVNAGTAILPVYLNRLLSNNTGGMVYPLEDGFCYFDRSYVEALDAQTRTYSATGTRVYFQILLQASGSELAIANGQIAGATYDFPELTQKENLQKIAAASEFLAERYDDKQSGLLSGLIVGSSIDQSIRSYTGGLTVHEYGERYAFYLLCVASSARMKNAALDVLIPFSAVDTYSNSNVTVAPENYDPSVLLKEILFVLDSRLEGGFSCGTMIESNVLPLSRIPQTKTLIPASLTSVFTPEYLFYYEDYLKQLQKETSSAPSHFVYRWEVPSSLEGNILAATYGYSYYRLLRYETLSSFVVSFSDVTQKEQLCDLVQILRYIDTSKSEEITAPLLSSFGKQSWEEVLLIESLSIPRVREVYRISPNFSEPSSYQGSFDYFDFSAGSIGDWFAGIGCKRLRLDLLDDSIRGIRSVMSNNHGLGASELLCLYEFPENFVYTPYLKITMELTDTGASADTLYEITVSLGNDRAMILAEQFVSAGERCEIWLDLRELDAEDLMAEYIKIGAEPVEGEAEEFSLWFLGLTGYSEDYSSEELSELIDAERLRIRNQNADENEDDGMMSALWLAFGILLLISVLVLGIVLFFRRKDEEISDEKEQKNLNDRE